MWQQIKWIVNNVHTADVAPKSEVARDIFDEIRNDIFPLILGEPYFDDICGILTELKKKYMEESGNER